MSRFCTRCGIHPLNKHRKGVKKGLCCNKCPLHGPWCTLHLNKASQDVPFAKAPPVKPLPKAQKTPTAKAPPARQANHVQRPVTAKPSSHVLNPPAKEADTLPKAIQQSESTAQPSEAPKEPIQHSEKVPAESPERRCRHKQAHPMLPRRSIARRRQLGFLLQEGHQGMQQRGFFLQNFIDYKAHKKEVADRRKRVQEKKNALKERMDFTLMPRPDPKLRKEICSLLTDSGRKLLPSSGAIGADEVKRIWEKMCDRGASKQELQTLSFVMDTHPLNENAVTCIESILLENSPMTPASPSTADGQDGDVSLSEPNEVGVHPSSCNALAKPVVAEAFRPKPELRANPEMMLRMRMRQKQPQRVRRLGSGRAAVMHHRRNMSRLPRQGRVMAKMLVRARHRCSCCYSIVCSRQSNLNQGLRGVMLASVDIAPAWIKGSQDPAADIDMRDI